MRCAAWSLALLLLSGCDSAARDDDAADAAPATAGSDSAGPVTVPGGRTQVVLASTTSTEDSGLFDVLIPAFERAHPQLAVRLVAVGTGQALELGRRKDADVLLVHARASESEFVAAGLGIMRCDVMYNDFVLVGPTSDPAQVRGAQDPLEALRRIERSRSPFVSRGDDSGTHRKELDLWEEARLAPRGGWYMQTGQGMGEVLTIAGEKSAYTITDRATFLAVQDKNPLEVLHEGDRRLINQYGVVLVSDARNQAGAAAFAAWVTGVEGQQVIADFGVARFGRSLFVPNANECAIPELSAHP